MAREKFQTLTEPMFYILLCLRQPCCGIDIMGRVREMTHERVQIGSGTLYNLLEQFLAAELIRELDAEGRRRSYVLSAKGQEMLEREYNRLTAQIADYRKALEEEGRQ